MCLLHNEHIQSSGNNTEHQFCKHSHLSHLNDKQIWTKTTHRQVPNVLLSSATLYVTNQVRRKGTIDGNK